MIACSRPGGQPANLQGMWNHSDTPAWGSKYTININTQMNYWIAEPGNLAECALPLVAMVEELARSGARTAREMYGARGWVAHHNTDLWRASAPVDGAFFGVCGRWAARGCVCIFGIITITVGTGAFWSVFGRLCATALCSSSTRWCRCPAPTGW